MMLTEPNIKQNEDEQKGRIKIPSTRITIARWNLMNLFEVFEVNTNIRYRQTIFLKHVKEST